MGFCVYLPDNLDHLWRLLDDHPKAVLYAGGTDVFVKARARATTSPDAFVGLERIAALKEIRWEGSRLFVGAASTISTILSDPTVRADFPLLCRCARLLGAPQVRNMATIGGNICTASPAGDTLPALSVLEAAVEIRSAGALREMPLGDFITGPGRNMLQQREILSGVWLDRLRSGGGIAHFEKVGQRKALAISVASLAATLDIGRNGRITKVRLAFGSVGPKIVRCPEAERELEGKTLSVDSLRSVLPLVDLCISPIDDIRASAQYRRLVSGNLLLRLSRYCAGSPAP